MRNVAATVVILIAVYLLAGGDPATAATTIQHILSGLVEVGRLIGDWIAANLPATKG